MPKADSVTSIRLLQACEDLLRSERSLSQVTVRRIAAEADVNASAISYHFGSHEKLVLAVGQRVYQRLNAERLTLLRSAMHRAEPEPPDLAEIVAALVGPSVRWSLDPRSAYGVLQCMTQMAEASTEPDRFRALVDDVAHHRIFIDVLKRICPWLDDAAIGWRLSCALGIRSQVIRQRDRTQLLTGGTIDLDDADGVIARMVEVIVPMFAPAA